MKSLASLRGTFRCGWMCGINSDLVQRYVRIICAINMQALSGLMKQAYTYSIAVDVGSVRNTGYMDLRVRLPTPSGSFINVHVLPIPLLSGKSIDIFGMVDFVFVVNAMLEYLLTSYFFCFFFNLVWIRAYVGSKKADVQYIALTETLDMPEPLWKKKLFGVSTDGVWYLIFSCSVLWYRCNLPTCWFCKGNIYTLFLAMYYFQSLSFYFNCLFILLFN